MGVSTRDYMKRPLDGPRLANAPPVPSWEEMANVLRVRLMQAIEHCPIQNIQDAVALVDAAATLQVLHGRGKAYDATDTAPEAHD